MRWTAAARATWRAAPGKLLRMLGGDSGVSLIGVFLEWRLHEHPLNIAAAFHEAFLLLGGLTLVAIVVAWGMRPAAIR